ncbi:unnamed protein product [Cuscuta campestris]|uniref:Zinc finger GRF-type domain-containing protein n=1 Tax=Cuscuta campestris TaxID=132261 RepID=A0A484LGA5_9ASTE|nr:unnamed protein product [Cuscuta campestris]
MSSISSNNSHGMQFARCRCGEKVVLKTVWTESNPGRRFLGCSNYGRHNFWHKVSFTLSITFFLVANLFMSLVLIISSMIRMGFSLASKMYLLNDSHKLFVNMSHLGKVLNSALDQFLGGLAFNHSLASGHLSSRSFRHPNNLAG